jgi:plasmid stabilization system protein ParE
MNRSWLRAASIAALMGLPWASLAAGKVPLGTYQGAGCDGLKRHPRFSEWLGRKPDLVVDFFDATSWDKLESSANWIAKCWSKTGIHASFALPMLTKNSSDTLADGAAGKFDDVFRRVAKTLVNNGYADAVVRIGWEFNGSWFPWAAAKDPEAWKAYWRRIVTVMRQEPGAKFRFDWCPNLGRDSIPPDAVYPGDAYVDIIGADVYNQTWVTPRPSPEKIWDHLVNQSYGLKWQRQFAAAHGKPVSFPEWGTGNRPDGHGGGDDPYFIERMAEWIASGNTAYQSYWDYPASDYNAKLSDGSKPAAAAAFLHRFKSASLSRQMPMKSFERVGPGLPAGPAASPARTPVELAIVSEVRE